MAAPRALAAPGRWQVPDATLTLQKRFPGRRRVKLAAQQAPKQTTDSPQQQAPLTRAAQAGTASDELETLTHARLFSNLDARTLKHEPGTVLGSTLLVAGTTVGAGILALPAVTQDAGFVASTAALTSCCAFSIITGLLIAEVNLNIMREQGAGTASLVTMTKRTLGDGAAAAASAAYVFLHYALLVAYLSRGSQIVTDLAGVPALPAAMTFTAVLGGFCYTASTQAMDRIFGALVLVFVASFVGLLGVAAGDVDASTLGKADWSAVPATLPVIALSYVYHNVVPVVTSTLEGDVNKIRTAIVAGVLIPYTMFVSWEAAILGSLGTLSAADASQISMSPPAITASTGPKSDDGAVPLHGASTAARSSTAAGAGGSVGASAAAPAASEALVVQPAQRAPALAAFPDGPPSSSGISNGSTETSTGGGSSYSSDTSGSSSTSSNSSSSSSSSGSPTSSSSSSSSGSTSSSSNGSSGSSSGRVADPLAALSRSNPTVGPLLQAFSFLGVATSYMAFILGLTDFLAGALQLPGGRQSPVPYALTLVPPLGLSLTFPDLFFKALDSAGTYGVLTLFGVLPAAMAWSERYSDTNSSSSSSSSSSSNTIGISNGSGSSGSSGSSSSGSSSSNGSSSSTTKVEVVPGGKPVLLLVAALAAGIIGREVVEAAAILLPGAPIQ